MKEFAGRIAVVTGGGSGMGRELVRQLAAEACDVAMCDVSTEGMAETQRLCEAAGLPQGLRVTTHLADVSDDFASRRFGFRIQTQMDNHVRNNLHVVSSLIQILFQLFLPFVIHRAPKRGRINLHAAQLRFQRLI